MMLLLIKNDRYNIYKLDNGYYLPIFSNKNDFNITDVKNIININDIETLKFMLNDHYLIYDFKDKDWDVFVKLFNLNDYDIKILSTNVSEYVLDEKTYISKHESIIFVNNYFYKYFTKNILKSKFNNKHFEYRNIFNKIALDIFIDIFKLKDVNYVEVL